MTLTSEMTRLTAAFEAARAARLSALDGIRTGVRRLLADARASRRRIMADHAKAIDAELKGLMSEAAIIRGRAEDLIEQLATRREREAATLRARLEAQVADLQLSVEELLVTCFRDREEMRARELAGRQAYRKALRAGVRKTLTDAAAAVTTLREDRDGAARIWRKHAGPAAKPRPAAAKAAKKPAEKASDDKPAPAAKGSGVDTEDKKKGPKDKSQG